MARRAASYPCAECSHTSETRHTAQAHNETHADKIMRRKLRKQRARQIAKEDAQTGGTLAALLKAK